MTVETAASTNEETLEPSDEEPDAGEHQAKAHQAARKIDSKSLPILVVLGFGGALLARYYALIGYIPEIKWEDSLTYITVLFLGGAGLLALYGLLLFLPGVIWAEVLVEDSALQKLMCVTGRPEPCPVQITKILGLPFLLFLLIAHVPMIKMDEARYVLIVGLVGLVPALAILGHKLNDWLVCGKYPTDTRRSLLTRYLLFFGSSALLSLVSLVIIYQLLSPGSPSSGAAEADWRELTLLGACSLISVVANVAVALQYRRLRTRALVTGVVAAFLLFLAGESIPNGPETLSARIMAQFGIGDNTCERTLFTTEAGGKLAARLNVVNADSGAGTAVQHVQILSGLGHAYYLKIGDQKIVFPKEMVQAWATAVNGCGAGSQRAQLGVREPGSAPVPVEPRGPGSVKGSARR